VTRSARKKVRQPLSPERIEESALYLIERDGFDAFSTRKLAVELGCEAMSIYHYFPSRAHLMDALLDRVVSEMTLPAENLPWQEQIRHVAFEYRAMAWRHPRFFQFMVLHRMNTATALGLLDAIIGIFRRAGFDIEQAARLFRIFGYYVAGAALDETSGYAKGPSAAEPVPDEIAARDYPQITAVNPYFKSQHHEATFVAGLDILLKGIAAAPKKARRANSVRHGVRRG
jgi:AcrR family transcriptional regulator